MRYKIRNNTTQSQDHMGTDHELRDIRRDGFGFVEYVDVLKDRILNTETPNTIGILGSWGSGKSSLMRFIEESIEQDNKLKDSQEKKRVETIWINVWELGTQEEVWHAFLQAIFSKIYKKIPWHRKIDWRKLLDQAARSSWRILIVAVPAVVAVYLEKSGVNSTDVLKVITFRWSTNWQVVGGVATQLVAAATLYRPAWDALKKSMKFDVNSVLKAGSYEAQISELMKLRDRFEKVVELAVGGGGRIAVFIDDLDRCTPDKVPEVLEAIKLFASAKGCVYVLAFDPKIVAGRIAKKYGFDVDEGINYLEKIVQIPFELPPLDPTDIGEFIRKEYKEFSWEADVFAKGLSANPRTIKRAVNTYYILLRVADKRVAAWEIEPLDHLLVAKMIVIQTRFKKLYAHLTDKPEDLIAVEQWAASSEPKPEGFDELVEVREQRALKAMFLVAGSRFETQGPQVRWYIFLGGDTHTVGAVDELRPDTKSRERLLSNDATKIEEVLKEITQGYTDEYLIRIRKAYKRRLDAILGDDTKYTRDQRLSATLALDLLEDFKPNGSLDKDDWSSFIFERKTVRVASQNFVAGINEETIVTAKEAGLELKLTKESRLRAACPPDYRIGRYPITNEEFERFMGIARSQRFVDEASGILTLPYTPGMLEAEAYWEPCRPDKNDWAYSETPASYQFGFDGDRIYTPESCHFWRDDGSEACEVKVRLVTRKEEDATTNQMTRALECELFQKGSSGSPNRFQFIVGPKPDSARTEFEVGSTLFVAPGGTKSVFITEDFFVRIRIMGEGYRELRALPPADQAFNIDIAVWDRKAMLPIQLSPPEEWRFEPGKEKHPATGLAWGDAALYCMYLARLTGIPYRLPTEIEWELAASGGTRRLFPWGNYWEPELANTQEGSVATTTQAGQYPDGESPYCCGDMAGNVWEWCADSYSETLQVERTGDTWQDIRLHGKRGTVVKNQRTVRGGSYYDDRTKALCSHREGRDAVDRRITLGFRVAVSFGWGNYWDRNLKSTL